MTRTVEDVALMLNVRALPDARDYRQGLANGVRGLRIAYSADLGYVDVTPDIAEAVARAVGVFRDLGAVVEPVDPGFFDPQDTVCKLWFTGAANALAHLSEGQHMRLFPQRYDLLLTPTLPIPAFAAGQEVADPARQTRWMKWTRFSYPFNLTRQPAATVPSGFTADGLPIGLHVVGPMHHDALVLRASRTFEAVHPFPLPDRPRDEDRAAP
jgi:aspartyl-tRNA(Asn)/glutamyl-tRNA(Gln) amidotransferase subunit A